MNFAGFLLKKAGWRFDVNIPDTPKCIICVAPHTSNWDFILGELAIRSRGMKAHFLMKDAWFFFPMGSIMKALGGIPVSRKHSKNLTEDVTERIRNSEKLWIAVTPEGTRSANANWHHGFLYMAHDAGVPVVLAYFDYENKVVCLDKVFNTTGDVEADMLTVKQYYQGKKGRFDNKFVTGL